MITGLLFGLIFACVWIGALIHIIFRKKKTTGDQRGRGAANQQSLPEYNINGLPMAGGVDVSGNPYGTM